MNRPQALLALSHEHGQMLAEAVRLRRGAAAPTDEEAEAVSSSFAEFFQTVVLPHLREEEETLFPVVVEHDECTPLLACALVEHQRLRRLAARLGGRAEVRPALRELGELLESHVCAEERELFPLIEGVALDGPGTSSPNGPTGPLWGEASEDLNATLLAWPAGEGPGAQVNLERDVFVYVVEGSATLEVDDDASALRAGDARIVPKGSRRRLVAGPRGVRYLSVHRRRPPLQISPLRPRP